MSAVAKNSSNKRYLPGKVALKITCRRAKENLDNWNKSWNPRYWNKKIKMMKSYIKKEKNKCDTCNLLYL